MTGAATVLIGGERLPVEATLPVHDPSTGEPFATIARGGPGEVDAAVQAARAAFDRDWRHRTARDRARLLRALAERLRADAEQLAALETRDTGKPLGQARTDVEVAAQLLDFSADTVQALHGEVIPATVPDVTVMAQREPHGVTAHITPWNYPLPMVARTAGPALATGNCCVVKPAEDASLTTLRLAEIALEVGFPPGALNVVPGLGGEAGAALAAHPNIDHLSFTGSVRTGKLVARAAAENAVPVALELGGKSPNLVFADADLERAVPAIVSSILAHAGQTCSAGSRLLVERAVYDRVVDEVRERFAAVRIGPGADDADLGPLINARQRDSVAAAVAAAAGDARVVTGGRVPAGLERGYFYEPTLLDRVTPDAPIAQEEVFGPVLVALPFDDAREAIAVANGTAYGLVTGVWTRDLDRALWLAREAQSGTVYVNLFGGGPEMPFGGVRQSGHGREKGFEALRAFTRVKTVAVRAAGQEG